jgi:hypothetical protein
MRLRIALMMLASIACGGSLYAAEAPAPTPAETVPKAEPATPAKPDDASAAKADEKPAAKADEESEQASASENEPAAKSPADQKASPQRFIPSEQVRADFDVSFPIDI